MYQPWVPSGLWQSNGRCKDKTATCPYVISHPCPLLKLLKLIIISPISHTHTLSLSKNSNTLSSTPPTACCRHAAVRFTTGRDNCTDLRCHPWAHGEGWEIMFLGTGAQLLLVSVLCSNEGLLAPLKSKYISPLTGTHSSAAPWEKQSAEWAGGGYCSLNEYWSRKRERQGAVEGNGARDRQKKRDCKVPWAKNKEKVKRKTDRGRRNSLLRMI